MRPPSRGADSVDSGLLSLVEQEQQYSTKSRESPRYNIPDAVGIHSVNECDDEKTQLNGKLANGDKTKLELLIEELTRLTSKYASLRLKSPVSAFACQVLTSFFIIIILCSCCPIYFATVTQYQA